MKALDVDPLNIDPANENLTDIWQEAAYGSDLGGGGGINWEWLALL